MQATARFSGHCSVYSSTIKPSFFSPISTRLPRPHPPPFLSYRPISLQIRPLSATMRSDSSSFSDPAIKLPGSEPCLRAVIAGMEKVYFSRNPTAKSILDLVRSHDGDHVFYDHVAFRTFGVDGHGIDSIAKFFLDFGYVQRDELRFPAKKLKALWFSPPQAEHCDAEPLPRVFISELLVDEMSPRSQEIIRKYTQLSGGGYKYAALASTLGCLTWGKPLYSDYELLSRESEYAAWTLVNGYAVNHVTISTHRLKSEIRDINSLNRFLEDQGFKLNSDGGVLKDQGIPQT